MDMSAMPQETPAPRLALFDPISMAARRRPRV